MNEWWLTNCFSITQIAFYLLISLLQWLSFLFTSMDALVYFWVFQSLMNTMDNLKQNKQNQKLSVFTRLYSLLLISVVVSTLTLLCFSYIVNNAGDKPIWKYQWLYVSDWHSMINLLIFTHYIAWMKVFGLFTTSFSSSALCLCGNPMKTLLLMPIILSWLQICRRMRSMDYLRISWL